MRDIPAAFQAHLDSGATTICNCWRIDPNWGAPFGFTDHDCEIVIDGVAFEAVSGFTASGLDHSLGLSIDNASASGVLVSSKITDADISRGRYDGAEVTQWLVNWEEPAQRVLIFRGAFGEVRRKGGAFEVELQGLAEVLNRRVGRSFMPVCDAALGDGRCGVDLQLAGYGGAGVAVSAEDLRRFTASGLDAFAPEWFARGVLTWTSGENAGESVDIGRHDLRDGVVSLQLSRDMVAAITPGDGFDIVAGCDKTAETSRGKFANLTNFRGFPHVPGENWTTAYPVAGGVYTGGPKRG